jgi:TP901 family phage tail tape measure protein
VSNQDYLATAFVQIKPRTVGFNAELRKQIAAAIAPIKNTTVLVSPSTVGFAAKLRTQVRAAIVSSGPHTVPVTPTLTKFRAQMIKQLNEKPIPVTVAPVGKTAGAAAGAVGTEERLTDAQKSRKIITEQLRESERLLKESTREGLPLKERDALVTRSQALAREALTRITEGQIATDRALIQGQLQARAIKAEAAGGRAAAGITSEKADLEAEANAAANAASKEEILANTKESLAKVNDGLVLSMDRFHQSLRSGADPAEKLAVAQTELKVVEKERIQLQKQLQGAQRRNEQDQVALIRTGVQRAQQFEDLIRVEAKSLESQKASQALSESQQKIAGKLATATKVEISALTTLKDVRAQEGVLQRQSTALDKLEETAQKRNAAATLTFVEAKRAEIAARQTALANQGEFIRSGQKEATNQKNIGRGLIATALSFLGLRGATLAAGGAFLAGAAAAATFAKAVGSAAALEQELNVFQATSDATADEMERVQETARQLGADITLPAVGASDAAQAMTQLAKAGLNVEDAMDGARGTLQLATAAEISNAEATELVASALNSFALNGVEAVRVADLLTGAANEAQGSITDMGIALQQSSAVARQAGISLEDTVALITLLAKNGIRGSDAGTSLRTAILRLIAPTQDANKALRGLGISVLDASGNLRPEAFADLQKALQGLDTTARNQTLRKIFGQDAIRAAVIFGREGRAGLDAVREATQEVGLASELAEARTKGFSGQVAALKNNAETLGLTLGKITLGPLGAFVDTLSEIVSTGNKAVEAIDKLNEANKKAFTGAGQGGGDDGGGFLSRLVGNAKDALTITGGDVFREIGNQVTVIQRDVPGGFETATQAIRTFNKEARESVTGIRNIATLLKTFESPDDAIQGLEKMRDQIVGTSEDAEIARAQLTEIINVLLALGRKPTIVELQVLFEEGRIRIGLDSIKRTVKQTTFDLQFQIGKEVAELVKIEAGILGLDAATLFTIKFREGMDPKVFAQILKDVFGAVPSDLLPHGVPLPEPAEGITGEQILGRIAGFDAAKVRAQLSGATTDLVTVLREEQAFLEQQLQRNIAKKQPGLKRALEAALLGVEQDLAAIADDNKQAAEDAANKIKDANKKAAAALISAFSGEEQKRLNAETIAAQTEGLKDDLIADKKLLGLYKDQRDRGKNKIKDAEALADFLKEVNQKIFDTEVEIAQDKKALQQSIRQQQREDRERVVTGLELDVELAVIQENKQREIALRRKLIKALEDQIKHEKGNTLKIKELRNEIARQKAAIKEAQGEAEDRNNAFKSLLFTFLQAQQGFAANLLTNLIPGGSTGGLVGGTTAGGRPNGPTLADVVSPSGKIDFLQQAREEGGGVGGNIATRAAVADGAGGPTKGGQSRELLLLERILQTLDAIRRGTSSPEAAYQRASQGAAQDSGVGSTAGRPA